MHKVFYAVILVLITMACKKEDPIVYFTDNKIVAHRGAWREYGLPQNSIASLRKAIEINCIGSECDIWLTKDDSIVVCHDIEYSGKTVEKSTYASLIKTKLSNGEMLPTLRQYLTALSGQNQTKLFIELKTLSYDENRRNKLVNEVIDIVSSMQMQDHVIYTSFVFNLLQRIHHINSTATTLFLGGTFSPAAVNTAGLSGICYDIDTLQIHQEWLALTKSDNLILSSWTVNNSDQFKWLLRHQADYVFTDIPRSFFKKMGH